MLLNSREVNSLLYGTPVVWESSLQEYIGVVAPLRRVGKVIKFDKGLLTHSEFRNEQTYDENNYYWVISNGSNGSIVRFDILI